MIRPPAPDSTLAQQSPGPPVWRPVWRPAWRPAWRQRLTWLRVIAVILVIAVLGSHRMLNSTPGDVGVPLTGSGDFASLSIYLPAEIGAGQPMIADVVGAAPTAAVSLLVGGALRNLTLTATASASGVARFTVSAEADEWSGQVSLIARSGSASGQGSFRVVPGPVVGPVTTVVGPRSIVADEIDQAMGVVIPMDRFGNAAVDGTPVRFLRVLPSGQVLTTTTESRHLVAWDKINSGRLAGLNQVHAEQGEATGPQTRMDEMAAPPVHFQIVSQGLLPAADGRSLLQLRSSVLRDGNRNTQADGTLVTLFGTSPEGSWRIPTSTVGGIARFTIEAPVSPGTVQLIAHCRGSVSDLPLTIAFARNGSTMPATATRVGNDVIVSVGPVIDRHGALVDDGAKVTAVARDSTGTSARGSVALIDGVGRVRIPSAALAEPLTVKLSLLGIQSTVSVS